MDDLQELTSQLEAEVEDPDEETFLLYSQPIPSQNLGFIDPKATVLDVVVGGRDFAIHQSPGVLSSTRAGGTTGAVLWKITPLFAEWISAPDNIFFRAGLLGGPSCAVIELGCGISPLNALALSSRVGRYVLTDQPYVHKLIQKNLEENLPPPPSSSASAPSSSSSRRAAKPKKAASSSSSSSSKATALAAEIRFETLDWETDQVTPALAGSPPLPDATTSSSSSSSSFDAVIACDCVFNYALVQPFVQTCVDVCKLRLSESPPRRQPCLCIVAQQLRNDDVFRSWLAAFTESFRVWRVPGEMLPEQLRPGAGFVVHVGVLREYHQ